MRKFYLIVFLLIIGISFLAKAQSFEKAIVSNLSVVNSAKLDFSPTFHKDGIVFVSNGLNFNGRRKMQDKRINQKGLSLLIAKKDNNGGLQKPELFASELVTSVHEGPLTFSQDYKTVYFSRNNNRKRGLPKFVELIDRMQIYKSELTDKGWSKPRRVEFDRETRDYCHPTLSADGKKLYFSSNRKGGYGGMDLYVSEVLPNGKVSKPVNLGAAINSDKNEVFPYIHADGTLYFSSNKNGGSGGLDIYYTRPDIGSHDFTPPLSIGAPFNSQSDDFGFIVDNERKTGYFSSNRNGGQGEDDIYSFAIQEHEEPEKEEILPVIITVLDKKTQDVVKEAAVLVVSDNPKQVPQKLVTDTKGQVQFEHNLKQNYIVTINNADYKIEPVNIDINDRRSEIKVFADKIEKVEKVAVVKEPIPQPVIEEKPIEKPIEKPVVNTPVANPPTPTITEKVEAKTATTTPTITPVVTTVAKVEEPIKRVVTTNTSVTFFEINKIFYDFDKANVRKDASVTLDAMAEYLKQNPDMMVEIEAHTDIRGSYEYNQKLSQRRAINAEQYLIKKGIAKGRIYHIARGKSMLVDNCVNCSETNHQSNRRAEIRIVKYGN